jgi:phenylalanine-4-hydroxylase
VQNSIEELKKMSKSVTITGTPEVPWFPTAFEDFDNIGNRILGSGDGIQEVDHPGFNDAEYRKRREHITHVGLGYKMSDPKIPTVDYTQTENDVWKYCYERLSKLFKTNACDEFNSAMSQLEKAGVFKKTEIPQLEDVSNFIKGKTGWRLKPVAGLLTQREFLNGLAFRIFHST